jgi:hypothetical protein
MARKRSQVNKDLPKGLRVRNGYYSWASPIDKAEKGLGKDRIKAIQWARSANTEIKRMFPDLSPAEWLQGRVQGDEFAYDPDRLLALDRIRQLHNTSTEGGVYFLILTGALQYVGTSRCMFLRFEQHTKDGRIPFDETRCLMVPDKSWRETLERAYIVKYSPPYNRAGIARQAAELSGRVLGLAGAEVLPLQKSSI